jgi:hypothetical protein
VQVVDRYVDVSLRTILALDPLCFGAVPVDRRDQLDVGRSLWNLVTATFAKTFQMRPRVTESVKMIFSARANF